MTNERHMVELDGLRAIAVLMVFFSHAYRSQILWTGVDLFFVLSGFLITGILLEQRRRIDLGDYLASFYKRRARRILPPYLVFLILISLFFGVGWMRRWYLFLFFMNTAPFEALIGIYPVGNLWSLAVEEQFYAVWPFVVRWLSGKALAWLAASLLFAAPLLRWAATTILPGHWNMYSATPFRMDLLAAGALIGIAWRNHRATVETVGRRYGLPIVVFAITIFLLFSWYPWFQPSAGTVLVNVWLYELSLVGSAGALLWALGRRAVGILTLRPMAYMGRISYTFYLVHPATIKISRQYMDHHSAFVAFAAAFLFSALSWHWMERPILAGKPRVPALLSAPLRVTPGR